MDMIYYIGYYNCDAIRDEERIVAPPSENKMKYMISALTGATEKPFEVVSPAVTRAHKRIKGKKQQIGDTVFLKTFFSFGSKHKLVRGLGYLVTRFAVFFYLLKTVRREDHLIVYHSLRLMRLIAFLKKTKKCSLTIEVEELYSDVTEDEKQRKKEIAYLQIADHYIFITELLKQEINTEKPSVISHGTYQNVPDYGFRFADDKMHLVYAGTLSRVRGGAFVAVSAAEHLGEEYVLELLGAGSPADVQALQEMIREVSGKTKCEIRLVGLKTGKDFDSYIQACQIGLSTQQADAKFGATSFPSKILMYMSNGVRVVSVRIPAVATSAVGEYVQYYDRQEPKEIAAAIEKAVRKEDIDTRAILRELDVAFRKDLGNLLRV